MRPDEMPRASPIGRQWFTRLKRNASQTDDSTPGTALSDKCSRGQIVGTGRILVRRMFHGPDPHDVGPDLWKQKSDINNRAKIQFGLFESYMDLYIYMRWCDMGYQKYSSYHEIVYGDSMQRPHMDIDLDLDKPRPTGLGLHEYGEMVQTSLINAWMRWFDAHPTEHHKPFDHSSDLEIRSSCDATKFSKHIIIVSHYHMSSMDAKFVLQQVIAESGDGLLQEAATNGIIDFAIYGDQSSLRMLGSFKHKGDEAYRPALRETTYVPPGSQGNLLDRDIFVRSLITQWDRQPDHITTSAPPPKPYAPSNLSFSTDEAYRLALDRWPDLPFEVQSTNGKFVNLKRTRPAECEICGARDPSHLEHRTRQAFLLVNDDGSVFFRCRHPEATVGIHLGNVNAAAVGGVLPIDDPDADGECRNLLDPADRSEALPPGHEDAPAANVPVRPGRSRLVVQPPPLPPPESQVQGITFSIVGASDKGVEWLRMAEGDTGSMIRSQLRRADFHTSMANGRNMELVVFDSRYCAGDPDRQDEATLQDAIASGELAPSVVLSAQMGTGKTVVILLYLVAHPDKNVCCCVSSVAAAKAMVGSFRDKGIPCVLYSDLVRDGKVGGWQNQTCLPHGHLDLPPKANVIITSESLWRLGDYRFDVVMCDEVNSQFKQFFSPHHRFPAESQAVWNNMVVRAESVIFAEKLPTEDVYDILAHLRREHKLLSLVNQYRTPNRKHIVYQDVAEFEANFVDDVRAGKRVAVATNSKAKQTELLALARAADPTLRDDEILCFNADSGNKHLFEVINEAMTGIRLFLYTPALNSCVSVTVPFDSLYGWAGWRSNTPNDFNQQLGRVRTLRDGVIHLAFSSTKIGYFKTWRQVTDDVDRFHSTTEYLFNRALHHSFSVLSKGDDRIMTYKVDKESVFYVMYVRAQMETQHARQNFFAGMLVNILDDGGEVVLSPTKLDRRPRQADLAAMVKEERKAAKARKTEAAVAAQTDPDSLATATAMAVANRSTEASTLALAKNKLRGFIRPDCWDEVSKDGEALLFFSKDDGLEYLSNIRDESGRTETLAARAVARRSFIDTAVALDVTAGESESRAMIIEKIKLNIPGFDSTGELCTCPVENVNWGGLRDILKHDGYAGIFKLRRHMQTPMDTQKALVTRLALFLVKWTGARPKIVLGGTQGLLEINPNVHVSKILPRVLLARTAPRFHAATETGVAVSVHLSNATGARSAKRADPVPVALEAPTPPVPPVEVVDPRFVVPDMLEQLFA